ncbi:MAG: ATP-binding protein [Candidatus Diapherotrites archaeon]|nr:ATP-binding protein [Candidatus Diapherotrites archaeon]
MKQRIKQRLREQRKRRGLVRTNAQKPLSKLASQQRVIFRSFAEIDRGLSVLIENVKKITETTTPEQALGFAKMQTAFAIRLRAITSQMKGSRFRTQFTRAAVAAFRQGNHNIMNSLGQPSFVYNDLAAGRKDDIVGRRDSALLALQRDLHNTRAYRKIYSPNQSARANNSLVNLSGFPKFLSSESTKLVVRNFRVPFVKADPNLLYFALFNLTINSGKSIQSVASRPWPIRITSERKAGQVHISVEDNGRGFDVKDLPSFFKGRSGFAESGQDGSGSGLVLVRHAVHLMGGKLIAYSAGPGKGARFTIVLPE